MGQVWTSVEGMMIGAGLDPQAVINELHERAILAKVEWYPSAPHFVGVDFAVSGGRLGVVRDNTISEGPTIEELAEELASRFEGEVRISTVVADHTPEGASPLADVWDSDLDDDEPAESSRIVEIGNTPASSVPLLAALEGIDLADIEGNGGQRLLLAELPAEKAGWNFGELPLITLSKQDNEFQIFLVTDDHLEHVVIHNWAMDSKIIPGAHNVPTEVDDEILDLVGDRPNLKKIADAVNGSNVDDLYKSTSLFGDDAVVAAVKALGLPESVAGFLLGRIEADEVEGAKLHMARGISNAIGRSVDIMLKEPDSPAQPLWESYHSIAVDRPHLVKYFAGAEAIVGTTLLTLAVRAQAPRRGWMKFGGVLGGILLFDSVAELSLSRYLRAKEDR